MNTGRTILSQVVDFVSKYEFTNALTSTRAITRLETLLVGTVHCYGICTVDTPCEFARY